MGADGFLRVSAAALNRVTFPRPGDGVTMLALERRATILRGGRQSAAEGAAQVALQVRAQPFGGAVRIRRPEALREGLGVPLRYDSPRSEQEQDLRILIPPDRWAEVKQFCLRQMAYRQTAADAGPALEDDPHRELAEEFADALGTGLSPAQYRYRPDGFVIENEPSATDNVYARGVPTVRVYRIFEVRLIDPGLCERLLENSARYADADLERLARQSDRGRANAALCLPLEQVTRAYLELPAARRYSAISAGGHALDASVAAVLPGVEVPQYERIVETEQQ